MKNWFFIAAILLTGCASVKETYSADGRKAFALNCSGAARGWDKCYAAAGDKCGTSGYDILDRNSEDSAFAGASASSTSASMVATKTNERTMLVACKK